MIAPAEQFGGEEGSFVVGFSKGERAVMLQGLAHLSLCRPGLRLRCEAIAMKLAGRMQYENHRAALSLPPAARELLDTANHFAVTRHGDKIKVLYWDKVTADYSFTLAGAVVLAAWLAVLADPELSELQRLVAEIKNGTI
jgi:hypothetical protein